MNTTNQLGQLHSKHTPSKVFLIFGIFASMLFIGVAIFIYFGAILPVLEGTMHFSGDITVLYWCILFLVAVGFGILALTLFRNKGKTFCLYDLGIVTIDQGQRTSLLYENMQDVYLFTSGKSIIANNIAFRSGTTGQWGAISAKYNNVSKAIDTIAQKHIELYASKMIQELKDGKSVTFHYIDYKTAMGRWIFSMGTNDFLKITPKSIQLTTESIIVDSKKTAIKDLSHFSGNNWINEIKLLTRSNEIVLRTSRNGIFSSDSFAVVMDFLINQK